MKKAFMVMAVLACAAPSMLVAQSAEDPDKMLQIFSAPIKTKGGQCKVILLNDRTVEALFPKSPAKAAFRVKARMTAVFLVQGAVGKEFNFNPAATIVQKGERSSG